METNTQKLIHSFGALADLGQEIADAGDFIEMVRTSLHLLLGTLAIRRGAVLELPSHLERTNCLATWGLSPDYGVEFLIDAETKNALASFTKGVFGGDEPGVDHEGSLYQALDGLRTQEIELIVPMIVRGKLTGLVALGGKASGEQFTSDDLEVIQAMVRHIGVGIHTHRLLAEVKQQAGDNRRLYFDLRAIYRDTVRAFAAAIDIKDKYTQGHSERVGKYSEIIAREMGWGEEEVEGMAIAGYLHDVGKLVVERDIINAPYKIDAKQSSELNRHPGAGFDILSPIHHPYADIPLMAKYHHERMDGRGYPDGLTDLEIPIGAKIVTMADSFDAMTTDRPYKTRRTFDEVIVDLRRNTGTQFDPVVVAAFCRALLKELNGETKERKFLKMLGKNYLDAQKDAPLLIELLSELDPNAQTATARGV
ncbi:MAG TPA: HD domain-containing phosphohydrolase [Pyrinomonadaceae bacterium]|jgi:HD-GYP domain-containing protein (c-di-GMP phosphodiesterase class II)|nr:HD domain-containing phosphohydrolase [Pyrinomonadaceae bacterium]